MLANGKRTLVRAEDIKRIIECDPTPTSCNPLTEIVLSSMESIFVNHSFDEVINLINNKEGEVKK
jgi:uncharacterized protein YlzI (FlbEa/FlbD family)